MNSKNNINDTLINPYFRVTMPDDSVNTFQKEHRAVVTFKVIRDFTGQTVICRCSCPGGHAHGVGTGVRTAFNQMKKHFKRKFTKQ